MYVYPIKRAPLGKRDSIMNRREYHERKYRTINDPFPLPCVSVYGIKGALFLYCIFIKGYPRKIVLHIPIVHMLT